MKKMSTRLLLMLFIITIVSTGNLFSVEKGEYKLWIPMDQGTREVAFFVPLDYDSTKQYPLIMAIHEEGYPPIEEMRSMIVGSATELGAILACPEDYVYDGEVIEYLYDYCFETFNIDTNNVIMTGYHDGFNRAFEYTINNVDKVRAFIGMAPTEIMDVDFEPLIDLPICFIVGAVGNDYRVIAREYKSQIEDVVGIVKLVEFVQLVYDEAYFFSNPFTADWVECYNFIQNIVPKIQVQLKTPLNGAVDVENPVEFQWHHRPEALYYDINIFNSEGELFKKAQTEDSSYTLNKMDPNQTYTWQVREVHPNGERQWSETWEFTTLPDIPSEKIVLSSPENGAVDQAIEIIFKWDASPEASTYHFQLTEDDFSTMVDDNAEITGPEVVEYPLTNLAAFTTFKWRVRSENSAGEGPWSDEYSFTTDDHSSVGDMIISNGTILKSKAYPNPANQQADIRFSSESGGIIKVSLFDLRGNKLLEINDIEMIQGNNSINLDLSGYESGTYIFQIHTQNIIEFGKVIIIK